MQLYMLPSPLTVCLRIRIPHPSPPHTQQHKPCLLPRPNRLLQLPGPRLDELGRAVWPVRSSDLNKAYRKLSLLVHPDKAPGPEARQAFEQLKQAYSELKDADKLVSSRLGGRGFGGVQWAGPGRHLSLECQTLQHNKSQFPNRQHTNCAASLLLVFDAARPTPL